MLRLPPTVIGLARSDIQDHDNRLQISRCKQKDLIEKALKNIVAPTPRHLTLAYRPLPQNAIDLFDLQLSPLKRSQLTSEGNSLVPLLAKDSLHTHNPTENDFYFTGFTNCFAEDISQDSSSKTSHVTNYQPCGHQPSQAPKTAKVRSARVPKNYLNSYSLDSVECISVAYERKRNLSNSASDLLFSSINLIGFHEETRGNSLKSPGVLTATSVTLQDPPNEQNSRQNSEPKNTLRPPSQLSSIIPRRLSKIRSMPGAPQAIHPEECFMDLISNNDKDKSRQYNYNETSTKTFNPKLVIPGFSPHYSPEHSFSSDHETFTMNRIFLPPKTHLGSYQVYNDEMPPELQPQTPANLPESRHRSRYHPSFTAPDLQYFRRDHTADFSNDSKPMDLSPVTSQVRSTRNITSAGLSLNNFDILYGRREDGDNMQNCVEGLRFSGAHVRLWKSDHTDSDNDDRIL
ncbi:hypothetical protein OnM2_082028 [Erysiphe neolycopersici]|uniref:Uncharacterized protein n=1 Tax=Erysiphe neolycopersici TaxID=212602 RepID=A0A420HFS2_9PEZI|nr:hypothetical protein OnM2_082028 [Erysiphe neolycopersici]